MSKLELNEMRAEDDFIQDQQYLLCNRQSEVFHTAYWDGKKMTTASGELIVSSSDLSLYRIYKLP